VGFFVCLGEWERGSKPRDAGASGRGHHPVCQWRTESAKLILRDLVNATVGFEALAEEIHKPAKSLHRMLSKSGNPTMSNILAVFAAIKRALKVEVHTQIVMA
jgi:hypothetical protein